MQKETILVVEDDEDILNLLQFNLEAAGFARWWLPDRFEFLAEIPKTGVGKFNKRLLRERLADYLSDASTA